jgi:hypothetical protein
MSEIACPFYGVMLIQFSEVPVFVPATGDPNCALIIGTDSFCRCILKLGDEPVEWSKCPYNPRVNGSFLDTGIQPLVTPGIIRDLELEREREFQELGIPELQSLPAGAPSRTPGTRELRKADPAAVVEGKS